MYAKWSFLWLAVVLIAASGAQGADPSLIGWWKLNDGAGTVAVDSSDKGNDGTLEDDAAWEAAGYWDGAVRLSGAGYIDCGNSDIYNTTDAVTLAAWVMADPDFSYPDWSGIIMRGGPNLDTFALYYNGPNQQMGFKLTGTSTEWHATGAAGLFNREWHHTAATYNGQTKIIYLDGQPILTQAISGRIATSNGRLLLGAGRDLNPPTHHLVGLIDDARVYTRGLSQAEIQAVMLDPGASELAADPIPADGATDVPRDTVLAWTPGEFAATHDVYLGTSFADVNVAGRDDALGLLVSESQDANTYDPLTLLDWGQTYYWRIDEVNGAPDFAIYQGDVWSFTVEPFGYPIENISATSNMSAVAGSGPEKTVDGSGLNALDQHSIDAADMWLGASEGAEPVYIQYEFDNVYKLHQMLVWNYNIQFELVLGFGLKDVTVQYSTDGVDWIALGDVQFTQATAAPTYTANTVVDLQGVAARYVRLIVNSGWGLMGQYGLSEVRFLYVPVQATRPQPASGATDVDPGSVLRWRAGREAAAHEIYLSADEAAVADGTALVDTVADSSYRPADLAFGTTYYWRVDEVNEAQAISSWQGNVWRFATQEFAVVDGFESYDDEDNRIYDTWIDGWVNETGSTVGYLEEPFAERSIVNGGRQSMPLQYDNSAAPFYSEAERDLGGADWSARGADTLRLSITGQADNDPVSLYVALADTAGHVVVVTHADSQIVLNTTWQEWLIPLSDFGGVNLSSVRTMYIGLGDRTSPSAGGTGLIFIDDIGVGHPAASQ